MGQYYTHLLVAWYKAASGHNKSMSASLLLVALLAVWTWAQLQCHIPWPTLLSRQVANITSLSYLTVVLLF